LTAAGSKSCFYVAFGAWQGWQIIWMAGTISIKGLRQDAMHGYMNKAALAAFSSFDAGR
jgi:hypothetical protein